jgi:hypothetical protein
VYEFKDSKKEEVLNAIKRESSKYMFGTGFAMGFFIYLAKDRNTKAWLLPAFGILAVGKYYGDRQRVEQLRECDLESYLQRSTGFDNHLRYFEFEIENYDRL